MTGWGLFLPSRPRHIEAQEAAGGDVFGRDGVCHRDDFEGIGSPAIRIGCTGPDIGPRIG